MSLRRLRSEDGQSTLELAGTIVWIVLAGLFAFQLAVVGWTAVSAGNAARTAARLVSRGDSESDAANAEVQMLAGGALGTRASRSRRAPATGRRYPWRSRRCSRGSRS